MSTNLFEVELANLEDDHLHKATESSENKRQNNHRRLAARRAVEDHLERQRLRQELDDWDLELL
ncbi:MAG: hypothetical protein LAT62_07275 [Natronospirillum sp.]|uniref:PA3496 family putative envelope integrity protein n=1 Tax=Natronospirillum sp. TaxID=2812955 RepID=UPI0025D018F7|nr:hypothetical protein [Natronospirillum sp.]MCH8551719.1 hypothetical protein [Natronospirillum sp.]